LSKITPQNGQNEQISDKKNSISGVIQLTTLKAKKTLKYAFSMPKIMLLNFLNDSKSTLKNSRNRLFCPQKCQKLPRKTAKMGTLLIENYIFRVVNQPLEL